MITVSNVNNIIEWNNIAHELLVRQIAPKEIIWIDQNNQQSDLFARNNFFIAPTNQPLKLIPSFFKDFSSKIACHRDVAKWDLLYKALWRITHGEKHLLEISIDPLVRQLLLMLKHIHWDAHKMKAFVRFRRCQENNIDCFIAWYEPDHKIVRLVAPFFKKRFAVQLWTIMTPDETVHWDGEKLIFSKALSHANAPEGDEIENLWRTFYQATFNPARIKLKAMHKEMPVRFWKNLPESSVIPAILNKASSRLNHMLNHQEGLKQSARDYFPKEELSIINLQAAASCCQACPIFAKAHQVVFGSGKANAPLMLVGEQPGENEDLLGKPFVGPAGKLLRQVLKNIGISEEKIYFTNAVKHFKHQILDGKKLHRSPNIHEIHACKPWLLAEISAIKPKYIICLGLSAARSLINAGFHMNAAHGKWFSYNQSQFIMATYHPAAVLRSYDQNNILYQKLFNDLNSVLPLLADWNCENNTTSEGQDHYQ